MNKKIYIMILFFLIVLISGCKDKELIFNKMNPEDIIISVDGNPNDTKLLKDDFIFEFNVNDISFYNNRITLDKKILMNIYQGKYELIIKTEENIYTYKLSIINYNKELTYITRDNLFKINDLKYYVLFTKEDCYSCEKIKPNAILYHDYSNSYNNKLLDKLYFVTYENPINKSLFNSTLNIEGVNDVNNLSISSFPTLIVIKNNQVNDYYIGAKEVGDFLKDFL